MLDNKTLEGAMKIRLDNEYPEFQEGIRRAPDRGFRLTKAQTKVALKNALRKNFTKSSLLSLWKNSQHVAESMLTDTDRKAESTENRLTNTRVNALQVRLSRL